MPPGTGITSITLRKCGRPLALGDIDGDVHVVQKFMKALRRSCTPVNTPMILVAAEEIINSKDHTLFVEDGGHIHLTI